MTTETATPAAAPGLPADPAQDQLVDLGNQIEGLLAAVELASDAIIGLSDPVLAQRALPALCDVLRDKQRDLVLGLDRLTAEGLRHD